MKVLIVEDEMLLALDITSTFEAEGHEIVGPYGSGEAAMSTIDRDRPEFAILDHALAGLVTGLDLAGVLRMRGIHSILASAHNDIAQAAEGRAAGFMPKPYVTSDLLSAFDCAVRHTRGENVDRLPDAFRLLKI